MSAGQLAQRARFENASFACRFFDYGEAYFGVALYGHENADYVLRVKDKSLTGYNLCIKEYLKTI